MDLRRIDELLSKLPDLSLNRPPLFSELKSDEVVLLRIDNIPDVRLMLVR